MTEVTQTQRPARHNAPPFSLPVIAGIAVALSFLWVGLSLFFGQWAPADYATMFQSPQHAYLRALIPMTITGLVMYGIVAATGRLRPELWRDGADVPPAPKWMWIFAGLTITVAVIGLVRRALELDQRGVALTVALLLTCVAIGVTEELVMRAFVLSEARRRTRSEVRAAVMSMVLFGAWHLPNVLLGAPALNTLLQFLITATIGGLELYCLRRVTRSVFPAMAGHALYDFAVL